MKVEVMLPFVLADGGGTTGAFWHSLILALLLAVINTSFERVLCVMQSRSKRFLASAVLGLAVALICACLLAWWKAHGMLRNPIAAYGVASTALVIGAVIFVFRLGLLAVDESERKVETTPHSSDAVT